MRTYLEFTTLSLFTFPIKLAHFVVTCETSLADAVHSLLKFLSVCQKTTEMPLELATPAVDVLIFLVILVIDLCERSIFS